VTVFIDTAVIMYASGGDHPLQTSCGRIIAGIGDGEIDAVTSAEVIQEILHRFLSLRRPEVGRFQATKAMDLFAPVLPITHALMRSVPDLAAKYPALAARDLVHVATCVYEGITDIISPDKGFDQVTEIRRIDPRDFASIGDPA
jgi:predicted nucleic acid-binding protein